MINGVNNLSNETNKTFTTDADVSSSTGFQLNDENDQTMICASNHQTIASTPIMPTNPSLLTNFSTVVKKPKYQTNGDKDEQLALCKIKLDIASSVSLKMAEFLSSMKENGTTLPQKCNCFINGGSQNSNMNDNTLVSPTDCISPGALAEVMKERDSLRREVRELENGYSSLFKRYEKMREDCVLFKNNEEELQTKIEEEKARFDRLCERYSELRENASEQLNRANSELDRQARQHEEATLGLRCRVRKYESELQSMGLTLQGKDNQIEELNKLCDELMQKNGIVDDETIETDNASYSDVL